MDEHSQPLNSMANDLKAKGYQLQGVFSHFASKVPRDQVAFFNKTINEIIQISNTLSGHSEGIKKYLKQLNNEARESRKKIIELKKENLKLKKELDEYTTDIDSSWLMSSQEDNQGASSSQPAQGVISKMTHPVNGNIIL